MFQTHLEDLPPDALICILLQLTPADLVHLRRALPLTSSARTLTHHPFLWSRLYSTHFPELRSVPHLTITPLGTLDWRTAFRFAERRKAAIERRRLHHCNFSCRPTPHILPAPSHSVPSPSTNPPTTATTGGIRIILQGNIRRIVSDTSERSAANVTWDSATRAARFDWTGRQPSLPPPRPRKLPSSRPFPPTNPRPSGSFPPPPST